MKKKLYGTLFILAVLIGLLTVPAQATQTTQPTGVLNSGECGKNGNDVTWTLSHSGELTIQGVGEMRSYTSADDVPWHTYSNRITTATIGNGVTVIGNNAFRNCTALASVTLPGTLREIGNVAFYYCSALEEIEIPQNVTTIGQNAFGYCALTQIELPANVSTLGDGVFYKCANLESITVAEGNEHYFSVDDVLFEGTGTENSRLLCYPPKKAEPEGGYIVPEGVQEISAYAFQSATLRHVTIPEGVETIGEWAFSYNSALSLIEIPVSLTRIGNYAFYECKGLSDDNGEPVSGAQITYQGSRQEWASLDIGVGNFRLTNAHIEWTDTRQDNVIASGECGAMGSNVSWSLNTEGKLTISGADAMTNYRSADNVPWAHYTGEISSDLNVTVENGNLRPLIQSVSIEGSVTNIGNYAFSFCENLESVSFLSTLQTIGANAFADCTTLTEADLSATQAVSIGNYAFSGCSALQRIVFPAEPANTYLSIGERAFLYCSALESVTIPARVNNIGKWAFRWCNKLTTFTMASPGDSGTHYTAIWDYALANCPELQFVTFSDNLTVLGEYALTECAKLETVAIPQNVSGIGNCAFHALEQRPHLYFLLSRRAREQILRYREERHQRERVCL